MAKTEKNVHHEFEDFFKKIGIVYLNPNMPLAFERFADEEDEICPHRDQALLQWEIKQLNPYNKLKEVLGRRGWFNTSSCICKTLQVMVIYICLKYQVGAP